MPRRGQHREKARTGKRPRPGTAFRRTAYPGERHKAGNPRRAPGLDLAIMTDHADPRTPVPRTTLLPAWRRIAAAALWLSAGEAGAELPGAAQSLTPPPGLAAAQGASLQPDSTIGDVLHHPDLRGFSRRMLPWADRAYDEALPLAGIEALLPYHSALRPEVGLAGLNRVLALQRAGVPVFHEIYSDAERAARPELAEAGLFFFPGRPGAPFALIAPGGGFAYVGAVHEGFPHAMALNDLGYNAFVVTYRTGRGGRVATADMARALDHILQEAERLGVARAGYSLWGSSAGARMAAFIGSHGAAAFGARTTGRPAAVVMAYTSHADLGAQEVPTYAITGSGDSIAPPGSMRPRIEALMARGTDVTFRVIDGVGHGFGTGQGTPAQGWITEAAAFWQDHLPAATSPAPKADR